MALELDQPGFFPDYMIEAMVSERMIRTDSDKPIDLKNNVQASTFQPTISDKVGAFVLEPGKTELVPLNESFWFPMGVSTRPDTRSTFGKVDVEAKLVTVDGEPIPRSYQGGLAAQITSNTFRVRVPPGLPLDQARFRYGGLEECMLSAVDLAKDGKSYLPAGSNGIRLGLGLYTGEGLVSGHVAKKTDKVLDLAGGNDKDDFFEDIRSCLSLNPSDSLYLFWTSDELDFEDTGEPFICEMPRLDPTGRYPVNRASFIEYKSWPSRKALEIRPIADNLLHNGEAICDIYCYSLLGTPKRIYGPQNGNHNLSRLLSGIIQV